MMNSNPIFSHREAYRFMKVQRYFERYKEWEKLGQLESCKMNYPQYNVLTLNFTSQTGKPLVMLVYFVQDDTIRIRFNPMRNNAEDYNISNPYNVIKKNFKELQKSLKSSEKFRLQFEQKSDCIMIKSFRKSKMRSKSSPKISESQDQIKEYKLMIKERPIMKVKICKPMFGIQIYNCLNCQDYLIWKTAEIPIYFTPNGHEDYAVIQSISKPATSKFIGFGEQGGHCLSKNTAQANYFNFDNMRYMQVYNQGPLDGREPLYHSDPIFFEYNGVPDKDNVNCIFVDNPGQILMDIGYINSHRYMFGTRFGDLDYYYFMGNDTSSIIQSLTAIIGRSELKPRYILGYHQGCYGYDTRQAAEWVVKKYRQYKIPLDGLHIDVDLQHQYQTFTIDTTRFPNPKQFFGNLRKLGIKCSTNITPVISCIDPNYQTYKQGLQKGYFVLDKRYGASDYEADHYQCYGGGNQYQNYLNEYDKQMLGFNSGQSFIGAVYYGNDANGNQLGTPGHYPDLDRQQVRDWWGKQYQYLFDCGLQMVWQDMTTPAIRQTRGDMKGFPFRLMLKRQSDYDQNNTIQMMAIKIWNEYSYNLHRATFEGLNKLPGRQNKRNFIIGRGSFTGSSKFAGLWTGDNASEWNFLRMNVSQALSLGMSGVLINGQDIGGFECNNLDNGKWASPELMIRWTAAGAFLPWFRNHYVRKGRKEFQQPFMYVEWFNQYNGGQIPQPQDLYRMVMPICKHYIQLRYKLMQLFYDAMFKNQFNGLPICRPMFINIPNDKALFNDKEKFLSNQFFVGRDLLVAPILWPQIDQGVNNHGKRDIYLPASCGWYCYMNNIMPLGHMVEGGTTVRDFDANINIQGNHIHFVLPLYVREGGIIPTIQPEQHVGQRKQKGIPSYITINIYPGKSGNYSMFLDDGVSRQSSPYLQEWSLSKSIQKNKYQHVKIYHEYPNQFQKKIRKVYITKKHNDYTPDQKYYFVAILLDPTQNKITNVELEIIKLTHVMKPQVIRMLPSSGETSPQTMHSQSDDQEKAGLLQPPQCQQDFPIMSENLTYTYHHQQMMTTEPQKKQAMKEKIPNPEHALLYRGKKVCKLDQINQGTLDQRINKFMNSEADYNCWYYNQNIRIAYIKLEDCPEWKAISLTLTYGSC